MRWQGGAAAMLALASAAWAQTPAQVPGLNRAAISGAKQDEATVERGGALFAARCASCHGAVAKGTAKGADLIRSVAVRNDEKGNLIGPAAKAGAAHQALAPLTDTQVGELASWLRVQVYTAGNAGTYDFLEILTGDAKRGEAYFNGAGKCNTCHSVEKDLAGIGSKYDPPVLQSIWLSPNRGRGAAAAKTARTVTVTPKNGTAVSGTLEFIDEFNVSLRDAAGNLRSFAIDNDEPKVEIKDPLQPHFDMYRKVPDSALHDVTAYLVGLK